MVSTFATGIAALSVIETASLSDNAKFLDIIDKHCLTSVHRYLILSIQKYSIANVLLLRQKKANSQTLPLS